MLPEPRLRSVSSCRFYCGRRNPHRKGHRLRSVLWLVSVSFWLIDGLRRTVAVRFPVLALKLVADSKGCDQHYTQFQNCCIYGLSCMYIYLSISHLVI